MCLQALSGSEHPPNFKLTLQDAAWLLTGPFTARSPGWQLLSTGRAFAPPATKIRSFKMEAADNEGV